MTLSDLATSFTNSIITSIIGLLSAFAIAMFFYGIVRYLWGIREGEEGKIKEGNKVIVWSMIALFVMFSIWGIITFGQGIFGFSSSSAITIPNASMLQVGNSSGGINPAGLPSSGAQTVQQQQQGTNSNQTSGNMPVCGSAQDNGTVSCSPSNGSKCQWNDGTLCVDSSGTNGYDASAPQNPSAVDLSGNTSSSNTTTSSSTTTVDGLPVKN